MTENGRQKGTLSETLHKELWVVISRYRSPLPLRIAKWALFLSITRRLYGTRWFWAWILGPPGHWAGDAPPLPAHDARLDKAMGRVERCEGGEPDEATTGGRGSESKV